MAHAPRQRHTGRRTGRAAPAHADAYSLARGEVPVCVALRLFLPAEWTDDPARCRAAGVPEDRQTPRTKLEIALAELDHLIAMGVTFGCVLADAGYGVSVSFRQALSARGLTWAVGIPRSVRVFPRT